VQPDLRCYYHPHRAAAGQCDRCGDYLCAECVKEFGGQFLCSTCKKQLTPRSEVLSDTDLKGQVVFLCVVLGAVWAIAGLTVPLPPDPWESLFGQSSIPASVLIVSILMALPAAMVAYSFCAAEFVKKSTHYRFCLFVMILHCLLLPVGVVLVLIEQAWLSDAALRSLVQECVGDMAGWMSRWGLIVSVLGLLGLARLLQPRVRNFFQEKKMHAEARHVSQ